MLEPFSVYDFRLESAHDVDGVIESLGSLLQDRVLVQVAAYMHNTVLVQSLVQKFARKYPEADIVMLPAGRDEKTRLTVYTCKENALGGPNIPLPHALIARYHDAYETLSNQLKSSQEQVVRRHFVDPLTNLPNLYQLRNDLLENDECTFIAVNIDNFKLINDFYGFIVGDFILEQTALKLIALSDGMQVYRMYGDEFAVLLSEKLEFYDLKEYLEKLQYRLKNLSFEYQGSTIFVDTTLASSASGNRHNMFSKVGMALKYAKEMRLPYWIYEDRMHFEHEYESNLKIALKVRKAIESSGIVPYFQPIVCNKTDKIAKYECLSRLIDDKGNILPPKMFIDIAKTIKVYNQVTMSIIDQSFEIFRNSDYDFSINLSIEDLMNQEIYDFIIARLKRYGYGKRVTFELLETESIEDFKKVSRFIAEVKRYGARVAIDDFGSGFSNFSYLAEIDVDYIKIDGSLIANIDKNNNSRLIAETIVRFAKGMGIETIAEYVHSSTVLSTVKQLGIDYSQGYHIDEPHPKLP